MPKKPTSSFINKVEILAMAFIRSDWITKARQRLEGALGEYAKLRYAKLIGFDYDWSDEVQALLQKVDDLFDPQKVKIKWSDPDKAFTEAYFEAASAHEQLVAAKNQFIKWEEPLGTPEDQNTVLKILAEAGYAVPPNINIRTNEQS